MSRKIHIIFKEVTIMQFPNAASGSKKIFTGEVLMLFVAILSGAALIIGVIGAASMLAASAEGIEVTGAAIGGVAAAGAIGIAVAVLSLIALILTIVGVASCGKDEPMFKSVLMVMLISLIVSVISGFVPNATAKGVLQTIGDVLSLISTIFMIGAFMNLADKLGNEQVKNHGNAILKFLICLILIQLVLRIIVNFFGTTVVGSTVTLILGVVILIASLIQYFMYLSFLGRAKNMLNS